MMDDFNSEGSQQSHVLSQPSWNTPPGYTRTDPGPDGEVLWLYPKGLDTTLSNDFTLGAFHCPCGDKTCTHTLVHPRLVLALQTLRMMLGRPLALAAGFHCKPWHRLAGGRPRSYHTRGMAADIRCGSLEEVAELAGAAQQVRQIGGVGRYPARLTVHLDVRPRPRGGAVCWME